MSKTKCCNGRSFQIKKKFPPFFFFLEGSWVQGLLAFLCGVCRFSPVCLGSLQVLQLSLSVPGHAFEGKGGFGQLQLSLGVNVCVCVNIRLFTSSKELIKGGLQQDPPPPLPQPWKGKKMDEHTPIHTDLCVCVGCVRLVISWINAEKKKKEWINSTPSLPLV